MGFEGDIDDDDIQHCANTASLLSGVDVQKWFDWQDANPQQYKEFMRRGREETKHFILPFAGWRNDVVVFMGSALLRI